MINYTQLRIIRVTEFYFDEDARSAQADIVRHYWRSAPGSGDGWTESPTLGLDLTSSPQTLLNNMHHNIRYRVRHAEKDHFQYAFWRVCEPEVLAQFFLFYDRFAASAHLVPANRNRLSALARLGVLDLSRMSDRSGRDLVWHAHYRAPDRARLTHSASLLWQVTDPCLRRVIGEANCYHMWCDILRFKQEGLPHYDLGGWYGEAEDQKKLNINRFKESFGGAPVKQFGLEAGVTPIGRMALGCKKILLNYLSWFRSWKLLHTRQSHTASQVD